MSRRYSVPIIYRCGGRLLSVSVLNELDPKEKEGVEESYALVIVERGICMTKSALNSLSPMGAREYIQFVSCIHRFKLRALRIERESRAVGM